MSNKIRNIKNKRLEKNTTLDDAMGSEDKEIQYLYHKFLTMFKKHGRVLNNEARKEALKLAKLMRIAAKDLSTHCKENNLTTEQGIEIAKKEFNK